MIVLDLYGTMLSAFLSLLAVAAPSVGMVAARSVDLHHTARVEEAPLVFAHFMVSNFCVVRSASQQRH